LSDVVGLEDRTDVFAPGAPTLSSGLGAPDAGAIQHGTSQAVPIVAGVILLLQEFWSRFSSRPPSVAQLESWMRRGAVAVVDGDDEDDNVPNTGRTFLRVDAVGALEAADADRMLAAPLPPRKVREATRTRSKVVLKWKGRDDLADGYLVEGRRKNGSLEMVALTDPGVENWTVEEPQRFTRFRVSAFRGAAFSPAVRAR
jgi:hypothetical protein